MCSILRTSARRGFATNGGSSSNVDKLEEAFKYSSLADFLAAAATPSSIPKLSGLPEVVVTGRANVGKSTLLNAVLGRNNLVRTSSKAGRTRSLNFFRVGPGQGSLVLVDAPGYGARGREEWGELFDHYLENRKELRQVCLLINGHHGLTEVDKLMIRHLQNLLSKTQLQPIITKVDLCAENSEEGERTLTTTLFGLKRLGLSINPILCAVTPKHTFGIQAIRRAMAEACSQ